MRLEIMARLSTLRMLLGMAWRADRATTGIVLALVIGQSVADGLLSLCLRWVVDAAVAGEGGAGVAAAIGGGLALAVSVAGGRVQTNLQTELTERSGLLLDNEVLRISATLDGLEHLERPTYLDRLKIVREKSSALAEFGWSTLGLGSIGLRVLISLGLLITVHPLVVVLAIVFLASILCARIGQRRVQKAVSATAKASRREQYLLDLCTKPGPGKEVRVCGCARELGRRGATLWQEITGRQLRARVFAATAAFLGGLLYVLGFVGMLLLVGLLALRGQASPGDAVLLVTVANQLRDQARGVVTTIGAFFEGLHVLDQYLWLRRYAEAQAPPENGVPAPPALRHGIDIERMSFRYPDTSRDVLRDVTVRLPAGSVVALVGEHGAGKTTLVKLLCAFYRPTSGGVSVDDVSLQDMRADQWRSRLSAAFQDYARLEFLARENIGVGDLPRIDDVRSVSRAIQRADADDVLDGLPRGLETQLGRSFPDGVDLSQGQWQKLALSRAFMRDAPLLMVLDEPTASLDARTEQALFERYATHARAVGAEVGAITVLVSHRFSTVRMADLIVVMANGRVVQQGTHQMLMDEDGLYSELYRMQAASYE